MPDRPEWPNGLPPRFRAVMERMMAHDLEAEEDGQPAGATSGPESPGFRGDPTLGRTRLRGKDDRPVGKILARRLSEVEPRAYDWLWPGRIAFGEPVLFFGDCDQGKSLLSVALAAAVTCGTRWPDHPGPATPRGSVAFLQDEDSVEETLRPRVDAAEGNPDRIHAIDCVEYEGGRYDLVAIPRHAAELEYWLAGHPDVRVLVIDPVSSYLGGAEMHNDAEVRSLVLRPLSAIGRRRRVAVVMVGHVNKGGGTKAIYRAMGPAALVNAPRAAFLVATDPDDASRRLVASSKFNLGPRPPGLAYRFAGPAIRWEAGTIPGLTADAVLALERTKRLRAEEDGRRGPPAGRRQECQGWIAAQLDVGPQPLAEFYHKGELAGFARGTIHRALHRMEADSQALKSVRDGVVFYHKPAGLDLREEGSS